MVKIKKIPQTGLRITAKMETPHRVTVHGAEKKLQLDMPKLLGGTGKGPMPLEALLAAYAGSLNVVGNFVAHTTDFDLQDWEFTIWAEFDPRGIYGLAKTPKAFLAMHLDAKVQTPESEKRLAQLRKEIEERCPVHNLFKLAGVRFHETWTRIPPAKAAPKAAKKSSKKK